MSNFWSLFSRLYRSKRFSCGFLSVGILCFLVFMEDYLQAVFAWFYWGGNIFDFWYIYLWAFCVLLIILPPLSRGASWFLLASGMPVMTCSIVKILLIALIPELREGNPDRYYSFPISMLFVMYMALVFLALSRSVKVTIGALSLSSLTSVVIFIQIYEYIVLQMVGS